MAYRQNDSQRRNDTIRFDLMEHIGVLSRKDNGWTREVNIVSWNDGAAKIDIREWDPDHKRMTKGVTLFEAEAETLTRVLARRYGLRLTEWEPAHRSFSNAGQEESHRTFMGGERGTPNRTFTNENSGRSFYRDESPRMTEESPRMTEEPLRMTEEPPRMTEEQQRMTEEPPCMTEANSFSEGTAGQAEAEYETAEAAACVAEEASDLGADEPPTT